MTEVVCCRHERRKLFVLADIAANSRGGKTALPISPIAFESVKHIRHLFDIERDMNDMAVEQRLPATSERRVPLVAEWIPGERAKLSRHTPAARRSATCSSAEQA